MRSFCVFVILTVVWGCGAQAPVVEESGPPALDIVDLDALNEAARCGAVEETIHGQVVVDPYRALEQDTPETWAWIDAQTAHARRYFEDHADQQRARRLETLLTIGYYENIQQGGERLFYLKREGDIEQPILYVADGPGADPRVLIDPNALGEHVVLDWYYASPRGSYVAYGLSSGGDERSTLYLVEVDSGQALSESIGHTRWSSLSWLNDESGFYYTRYPREDEPDYDPEAPDSYFGHLFFHLLGSDPVEDPLVYRVTEGTQFLFPDVADDDGHIALTIWNSFSQSDLVLIDRRDPSHPAIPISVGGDYLIWGMVHRGRLLIWSNLDGHPRYRILSVPTELAPDRRAWQEIIPEGEGSLDTFGIAGDYIVAKYVEHISTRLLLYRLDGTLAFEVELPAEGNIGTFGLQRGGNRVVFAFDSFFVPPTLYGYDPDTSSIEILGQVASDIDPLRYVAERATVHSADGTPINLFLVHPAGPLGDRPRPVLVTGYGGFNASLLPSFQRNIIYWLERGGVFVQANLRGGGEFGEEWHRAGMMENKANVFADFEAVVRWLSTSGISSPDLIAIEGGSNGGLLVGAAVTRYPDAFRVAVSHVGIYDMVRFHLFPPGELWTDEYGDPREADHFLYLREYSPYHNIVQGIGYPSILIETAENDARAAWQHSTKFAARLQEATSSDHPVLFFLERSVGHGVGSGRSDLVRLYDRMYTFIETELGMPWDRR